jgi:flagellar hook assembly protein FlgD
VRRVASGRFPEGAHRVRWDGRDDAGRAVAPGVYVYRLITPTFQASRHLAIVR